MRTKFNESAKNWTDEKLKSHLTEHDYIIEYLSKYLNYKSGCEESEYYDDIYVREFFFNTNEKFAIVYDDSNSGGNSYIVKTNKEYEELVEFLDNPDFFLDAKKYNI